VIVGADEYGRKELLAMTDGFRESTQSWREVLLDLKRRGLKQDPKLAIGDGALGFWTALREVFPTTREQRCWLHKTMNVLNAMPKSVQAKAKAHLHDIWQAETRAAASAAFDFFVEAYGVKWDKAVAKLVKDRDALLTFYDFPAEHWKHIRTSNPIESTFATVRHRTKRTKGCLSRKTGLAMAFRLMMSAQKKWRKLDGRNRLPEVIAGLSSATVSANFKPPPDHASPTSAHISRFCRLPWVDAAPQRHRSGSHADRRRQDAGLLAAADLGGALGDRGIPLSAQSRGRRGNARYADERLLHDRGDLEDRLFSDHPPVSELGLGAGQRHARDPDRGVAARQSWHAPACARDPDRRAVDRRGDRHRDNGVDGAEVDPLRPGDRPGATRA
jgi:hypothetical protein